ncbi:endonuclease III [Candidatus Pacearchaeota archaeon]|nr:endonuclease III [Candidatus Pacearchaeota archaeon]
MNRTNYFLKIFAKVNLKYAKSNKRLAGESWKHDWQTLIATIMSAQSRDETTIPIAERLFAKYPTLKNLANAKYSDVLKIFSSLNYNKTKTKNVILTAKLLVKDYQEKIPNKIEELVKLRGVGRKTANLVLSEIHNQDTITVDTHVHRISNILGLVKTKTPTETEMELQKIVPRKYWSKINRLFVLWGKDVSGTNKKKLLNKLKQ